MSAAKANGNIDVPEEFESLKQILQRYGMPALIGTGLAIVALFVFNFLGDRKSGAERDAMLMMSAASGPSDLEAIVSDFPKSSTAPLALLQLASFHYNNASYTLAQEKYDTFLSTYPDHEFTPAAELGRVHCLEALGNRDIALAGFRAFNEKHPNHFLTPQVVMGEGRTLEQLGRFEEAKIVYEDYLGAKPDDRWADPFEAVLAKVTLKIKTPALVEYTKLAHPDRALAPQSSADDFLSSIMAQPLPVTPSESSAVPEPVVIPGSDVPQASETTEEASPIETPSATQKAPENTVLDTDVTPDAPVAEDQDAEQKDETPVEAAITE